MNYCSAQVFEYAKWGGGFNSGKEVRLIFVEPPAATIAS